MEKMYYGQFNARNTRKQYRKNCNYTQKVIDENI